MYSKLPGEAGERLDARRCSASVALALLTVINCLGVRAGSITQNVFMILKLVAIAALVVIRIDMLSPAQSADVSTRHAARLTHSGNH